MGKVALITGITGQDGAYLADLLLNKGYTVHGIKRRSSLFNTDRTDHLYQDPHETDLRLRLHYGDLTDATNLIRIVQAVQPDEIYNLGAPADFIRENLQIELNVIDAAWRAGVQKLLFLGSSCIYPQLAPQPLREESLLTGPLEPTNEWYAVRQDRRGQAAPELPAAVWLPRQRGDADQPLWAGRQLQPREFARFAGADAQISRGEDAGPAGGGRLGDRHPPRREFLHVDDLADALLFLMERYDGADPINVGVGIDLSIEELARLVARVVGFQGEIVLDPSKPDGTPRKVLDVSRLRGFGWQARISLEDGVRATYRWLLENLGQLRV